MTFPELYAWLCAVLGALLWWPVGRAYGWWLGLAAALVAGFVGLLLGWIWGETLGEWGGSSRRFGATVALVTSSLGLLVFLGAPLWLGWWLRGG